MRFCNEIKWTPLILTLESLLILGTWLWIRIRPWHNVDFFVEEEGNCHPRYYEYNHLHWEERNLWRGQRPRVTFDMRAYTLQIRWTSWKWFSLLPLFQASNLVLLTGLLHLPLQLLYPNLLPRLRQLSLRLINLLLPLAPSVKDQPHHFTTPTKSGRDHDQHSPLEEGYPKRVSVSECVALGSATPFLWLPAIFLPRFHRTPEEADVVLFVKDLSFVQNLFEADKMKHISEVTYHTYWTTSIFSLMLLAEATSWPWVILPRIWIPRRGNAKTWIKNTLNSRRYLLSKRKSYVPRLCSRRWISMFLFLPWLSRLPIWSHPSK